MNRRYLFPLLFVLACGGVGAWLLLRERELPLPKWTPDLETAAVANNQFAFDLYAKLRGEPGNLFLSPICLHANLTSVANRTAGTTRDELLAALHLPKSGPVGDLSAYYSAPRTGFELKLASAAWAEKSVPWKADFLARTPGFRQADFATDPAGERAAINRWVSDQTDAMIPDLLPEPAITRDTRYVGANAAYFKADWTVRFDPALTGPRQFTCGDGTTVMTPMMSFGDRYQLKASGYGSDPEVVELPYRGGELSLIVLMPKEHNGLPALESKLSADTLAQWIAQLTVTKTDVTLPKFRHTWRPTDGDMSGTLKALGIRTVFDPVAADFSPMTAEKLSLDAVHHAAVIAVDEAGTRAAAAVADGSKSAAGHVVVDHPFLYLIRDNTRGTILFLGRFATP